MATAGIMCDHGCGLAWRMQGFIQDAGVKSLSYSGSGRVLIAGGEELDVLEDELAKQRHSHDKPGMVSLVVRNSKDRWVVHSSISFP